MISRLWTTARLDATVQWRNRLYMIGSGLGLFAGLVLCFAFDRAALATAVPVSFLLVGSASLIYLIGLLIFEEDEGTLSAQLVSPLRLGEYVSAKVATLSLLTAVEGVLLVLAAYGPGGYSWPLLLLGLLLLGTVLTLIGLLIGVRYRTVTDALIPLALIGVILQLPALWFLGVSASPIWLLVPSMPPALLIWGAWHPLGPWQLAYALGYGALLGAGLYLWARRAFVRHIVMGKGR